MGDECGGLFHPPGDYHNRKSDSSATNPYVAISNEMRDANKVAMETAATDPTADINTVITTAKDSIQEALDIYNQSNS